VFREVGPARRRIPEEQVDVRPPDRIAGIIADVLNAVKNKAAAHVSRVAGSLVFPQRIRPGGIAAVGRAGVERDPDIYRLGAQDLACGPSGALALRPFRLGGRGSRGLIWGRLKVRRTWFWAICRFGLGGKSRRRRVCPMKSSPHKANIRASPMAHGIAAVSAASIVSSDLRRSPSGDRYARDRQESEQVAPPQLCVCPLVAAALAPVPLHRHFPDRWYRTDVGSLRPTCSAISFMYSPWRFSSTIR